MTVTTTPLARPDGPGAPLVKWPGGKRRELPGLMATWPATAGRYLEPFVGGGAALFATDPGIPALVNDASDDLVALYRAVQDQDRATFGHLDDLAAWWAGLGGLAAVVADLGLAHGGAHPAGDARARLPRHRAALAASGVPRPLAEAFLAQVDEVVPRKLERMAQVEASRGVRLPAPDVLANVEGALRAAAYTTIRARHNRLRRDDRHGPERTATFAVLRELAYAAMFRFNADGDFNVPYGGISYNGRDLAGRVEGWRDPAGPRARLATTAIHGGDFEDFLTTASPTRDDFVFLDPPYLSDFRDYDGNGFGPVDHQRLASVLGQLPGAFQLVIKATPEVRRWYGHRDWRVTEVDKRYAWTIKGRNDPNATHLVIERG